MRRHFTGLHFWARLFRQLYEVDVPAPLRPLADYRSVTVSFPHSAQSYLALARPLAPVARR